MTTAGKPLRLIVALSCVVALSLGVTGALSAQSATAPAAPPSHWGPVSINLEEVVYPHPVHFMERELYGQVVRIAYMDVAPTGPPNGRTVILLHGGSYYGWYWRDQIDALARAGYRVVVEDRLGWGKSSKPILPYSFNLHAANTRALLAHLGVDRAAVVGHSMGGQLGSRFAFLYPDVVTHLVMVNPIGLSDSRYGRPWREPEWPTQAVDLQSLYESILRGEQSRVVEWRPEYLEHVRLRYGMALSGEWPRMAYVQSIRSGSGETIVHDWPQMRTKTLLVGGEEDGPNYPQLARNAVDALQNAELVLFPNVGHNPHLEVPDRLNTEILRFLGTDPQEPAGEGGR
jgi:pimeloyl-ACP methyl ester carboxylesterase